MITTRETVRQRGGRGGREGRRGRGGEGMRGRGGEGRRGRGGETKQAINPGRLGHHKVLPTITVHIIKCLTYVPVILVTPPSEAAAPTNA